jgi:hypothetical protein
MVAGSGAFMLLHAQSLLRVLWERSALDWMQMQMHMHGINENDDGKGDNGYSTATKTAKMTFDEFLSLSKDNA